MTDLDLILQPSKRTLLKLSLLDSDYSVLQEVQGNLSSLGLSISGDSEIRRVSNISMVVAATDQISEGYFGMWMDRMIWMSYGIVDNVTHETRWWLLGSFLFSTSNYVINVSSRQISISLVDMMAAATAERGTQIGYGILYPMDSRIEDALAATVARFSPYKKYDICEFEDVVPYDIEPSRGSYPIDAMRALVELFPWYEQYYSRDGVYTVRRIPTTMSEPVVMTADDMDKIIIGESGDVTYGDIKNCSEVWGKEINANYTAKSCISESGVYKLVIHDTYKVYESGSLIAFEPDSNCGSGQLLYVDGLPEYPIIVEAGDGERRPIQAEELLAGVMYVVKYIDESFLLQGEALIHVMHMEYNKMPSDDVIEGIKAFHGCNDVHFTIEPDSPFACDRIGIVKQVLADGDYSNIYTTELAHERAEYENWKSTRLQEQLSIEALFVPW